MIKDCWLSTADGLPKTRKGCRGAQLWLSVGMLVCLNGCDLGRAPESQQALAVKGLYTAALSFDGRFSLIGSIHHGGSLWNNERQERLFDWNHKGDGYSALTAAAISPDSKFGATADNRSIVIWDISKGDSIWFWKTPADVEAVALSDSGSIAAVGMRDYTVTLFDSKNGGLLRIFRHEGDVQSVAINRQGTVVLSGSDDGVAKVWSVRDNKEISRIKHKNQVMTVALSPDAKIAFSSSYTGNTLLWQTATGTQIHELSHPGSGYYRSACFSSDGRQLITGSADGRIQLWDTDTGKQLERWSIKPRDFWGPNTTQVLSVAFAQSGYRAIGANGLMYILAKN